MADLKQTVENIGQSVPGYMGYQSKERRRDADRVLRERLATQYSTLRDQLTRIMQNATNNGQLNSLPTLEGANLQLQRFISRLQTAPSGYAGWFDAAQIQEADLDQLYQFDTTLAAGVDELKSALDTLSTAVKSKTGVDDATSALRDHLDDLNARLDSREEFLARGKRPAPSASPLGALKAKAQPATANAFEQLKLNDAVSYDGTDYLVAGRIVYSVASGKFQAFLLHDRDNKRWLRVGPNDELAVTDEIQFNVPSPLPDTLNYSGKSYKSAEQGAANVSVEGASGSQSGAVNYTRYAADGGARLWVEDWGTETKVQAGQVVDPLEVKLYRKL
jgi:hypothetical protein